MVGTPEASNRKRLTHDMYMPYIFIPFVSILFIDEATGWEFSEGLTALIVTCIITFFVSITYSIIIVDGLRCVIEDKLIVFPKLLDTRMETYPFAELCWTDQSIWFSIYVYKESQPYKPLYQHLSSRYYTHQQYAISTIITSKVKNKPQKGLWKKGIQQHFLFLWFPFVIGFATFLTLDWLTDENEDNFREVLVEYAKISTKGMSEGVETMLLYATMSVQHEEWFQHERIDTTKARIFASTYMSEHFVDIYVDSCLMPILYGNVTGKEMRKLTKALSTPEGERYLQHVGMVYEKVISELVTIFQDKERTDSLILCTQSWYSHEFEEQFDTCLVYNLNPIAMRAIVKSLYSSIEEIQLEEMLHGNIKNYSTNVFYPFPPTPMGETWLQTMIKNTCFEFFTEEDITFGQSLMNLRTYQRIISHVRPDVEERLFRMLQDSCQMMYTKQYTHENYKTRYNTLCSSNH